METETTRLLQENLTAMLEGAHDRHWPRSIAALATLTGNECGDRPWRPAPVKPENMSNEYRSKIIEVDDNYAMTTAENSVFKCIISL